MWHFFGNWDHTFGISVQIDKGWCIMRTYSNRIGKLSFLPGYVRKFSPGAICPNPIVLNSWHSHTDAHASRQSGNILKLILATLADVFFRLSYRRMIGYLFIYLLLVVVYYGREQEIAPRGKWAYPQTPGKGTETTLAEKPKSRSPCQSSSE